MTLLEELARESAERERKKRQASQEKPGSDTPQSRQSQNVGAVAIYALCQGGDKAPLRLALNVCKEAGWSEPVQYVDWHIPKDKDGKPSMYNHMISDVSQGLIQVLVTTYASELREFCEGFGCKVVQAEG